MSSLLTALLLALGSVHMDAGCFVTGVASTADVARAQAACETARARFSTLFGVVAPAARIVLQDRAGYRTSADGNTAVVFWPRTGARAATNAANAPVAVQWSDVLPHETTHALLIAHLFANDAVSDEDGYGTPLPDWFEEAVAIWAEPATSRAMRLAQARALPPEMRDLETILTTSHPAATNRTLLAARTGAPLDMRDRALRAFYPQAFAVLSFVYDAGGTEAVRVLAERLTANADTRDALIGLPGLPADRNGLLRAWQSWLRF